MKRHELTNAQWVRIKPLLPAERGRHARPSKSNRRMVNAMLWILRTGSPWRDLPSAYGKWQSVYTRFSRWTKQGIWQAALDELANAYDDSALMIDATIVRAHQDASGVKGGAPKPSAPRVAGSARRSTPSSMPVVGRSRSPSPRAKSTK